MATLRQKKAFKGVLENGGIVSTAMAASGYTPATSKTPSKLTESKGWAELMHEYMPEDLIARKHKALLDKEEVVVTKDGIVRTGEIDHIAVGKGLEMFYKLSGRYAKEGNTAIQINVESLRGGYK